MNILDFKEEKHEGKILKNIFSKMKELLLFYKEFEPNLKDLKIPIDIDTYEGQQVMKDFLEIRTVEELMEMREAILNNDRIDHMYEEVSDSVNFLIVAYILYGWDENKFKTVEDIFCIHEDVYNGKTFSAYEIDKAILEVVYDIGLACNKLKIRPWKKSQYLTDMLVFEERLEKIFYSFIHLMFTLKIDPDMLWSIFSRKNQCNKFRIDTGY
jgi:hypothetical protein